jgi:hypothetical protein
MVHKMAWLAAAVVLVLSAGQAARAQDLYGAIAYNDSSRMVGWSFNYATQWAAEDRALAECGRGCDIVTWFRNACGALAIGSGGWGADWGNNRREAEVKALGLCGQYSKDCYIERWVCNG